MPILDHLRWATPDRNGIRLTIPPYQTGALGLLPRTDVRVGIRLPKPVPHADSRLAELHVTPFHVDHFRMFRLECLLWDRPGVVRAVLKAISHHGINVVKQDSCQINAGKHHYVDLILDWSDVGGLERASPSSPRDRWLYRCLRERIPIDDDRYLRLVESILVTSWNDLVFDRAHGRPLPAIRIQPFSGRRRPDFTPSAQVERSKTLPFHVELLIKKPEISRLRHYLEFSPKAPVPYFLTSDMPSRTLRVLVPSIARLQRMVHLAFRMATDRPGVLAAIGQLLSLAELNIVTSLLRQELTNESSWELVMEATSDFAAAHFPVAGPKQALTSETHLDAVLHAIRSVAPQLPLARQQVSLTNVRLTVPSYPRSKVSFDNRIFPADVEAVDAAVVKEEEESWNSHFTSFLTDARTTDAPPNKEDDEQDSEHATARFSLKRLVVKALQHRQPVLFLSYPASARRLAGRFKEHPEIRTLFYVDEYQSKNWQLIAPESIERIRQCDLFVGIWHPDAKSRSRLSPWMPFEYGVARALDLPHCLAYCSSLPDDTTKRIDPGKAIRSYDILGFDDAFIFDFAAACIGEWRTWINHAPEDLRRLPES